MQHPYNDIEGWFDMYETYQLLVDKTPEKGTIVEIGCWLGRSSTYLIDIALKSKKELNLYFIDTWKGSVNELTTTHKLATETDIFEIFKKNIEKTGIEYSNVRHDNINFIKLYYKKDNIKVIPTISNSVNALKIFNLDNEQIDTVFIDAEHTYEAVKNDIDAWYPLVKVGGIISGHDYVKGWDGVIQAVDERFKGDITVQENCWIHERKN